MLYSDASRKQAVGACLHQINLGTNDPLQKSGVTKFSNLSSLLWNAFYRAKNIQKSLSAVALP